METAIKVEDLGKLYRLGEIGTGTISHDLNRWFARIRGKGDPFAKIGEVNDRTKKSSGDYVWALQDVSFEVKKGEVLGIIGRNGAGKSTLLKILSKITTPTRGKICINGRIASLLEVGTGFHPELTGRENVFLNGAILGMTKPEIRKKFDEIVDFAGVDKYIDTPVKRYSSGMYVRLAFAVAAFLEPEILIVDEVLAVGDAEFQKKCLGRMQDVSKNDGKTVLFVSHNIAMIQKLCTKGLFLKNGQLIAEGLIADVTRSYLGDNEVNATTEFENIKELKACIRKVEILDNSGCPSSEIRVGENWTIKVQFQINEPIKSFICAVGLMNQYEIPINTTWQDPRQFLPGLYEAHFIQNQVRFAAAKYKVTIGLSEHLHSIQYKENVITFDIISIIDNLDENIVRIDSSSGLILNQMKIDLKKLA